LRILEKSHVVAGYDFNEMLRSGELAKGNPEMVGIVEGVEEIFVERVDIL
jgi:hypothetical protein